MNLDEPDLTELITTPDRDAFFTALAAGPPVRRARYLDGTRVWLITGYAEARSALSDPRFSSDGERAGVLDVGATAGIPEDIRPYLMNTLGAYDPPDHTRLRNLAAKAFTARRVARLRPHIERICASLLDGLDEEAEFIEDFAYPFPIQVICELLGVPDTDRDIWRSAAVDLTAPDPTRIATGARTLVAYMRDLITTKRANPADDLISALVTARDDAGDRLSDTETVALSLSMLIAGHETTVALIASSMLHLLAEPDLLDRLRNHPEQIPAAVEEFLRHSGPAEIAVMRYTTETVRFGDVDIPEGQAVQIAYAAANHDPRRFDAADSLDITRPDNPHLGFGHGIHYCLGAALARAETEIALTGLLIRFPRIEATIPTEEVGLRPGLMRMPATLPLRLR
ncbi:cytochrome P450 [Phytomonospora sp. NPDC050363]|uniref:cytochrome P450 family protein n=1 Tax=Phytomonospora sp. NPDC050363 TaxID=3155642 RepID=UPI0033C2FA4C